MPLTDSLLSLADDTLNFAPGALANGASITKMSRSADLSAIADHWSGKPLFLRVAPSRQYAPISVGTDYLQINLRGSESPMKFADGTTVTANTPAGGFTIASVTAHEFVAGTKVYFQATVNPTTSVGTFAANTPFYVTAGTTLTGNQFRISTTRALALAGTSDITISGTGTAVTVFQASAVLTQVYDPARLPTLFPTLNHPLWTLIDPRRFSFTSPQPETFFAPIYPAHGGVGAHLPFVVANNLGCERSRYATAALTYLNGSGSSITYTESRFNIDIVDVVGDSKKFYPSGIVPNIV